MQVVKISSAAEKKSVEAAYELNEQMEIMGASVGGGASVSILGPRKREIVPVSTSTGEENVVHPIGNATSASTDVEGALAVESAPNPASGRMSHHHVRMGPLQSPVVNLKQMVFNRRDKYRVLSSEEVAEKFKAGAAAFTNHYFYVLYNEDTGNNKWYKGKLSDYNALGMIKDDVQIKENCIMDFPDEDDLQPLLLEVHSYAKDLSKTKFSNRYETWCVVVV